MPVQFDIELTKVSTITHGKQASWESVLPNKLGGVGHGASASQIFVCDLHVHTEHENQQPNPA